MKEGLKKIDTILVKAGEGIVGLLLMGFVLLAGVYVFFTMPVLVLVSLTSENPYSAVTYIGIGFVAFYLLRGAMNVVNVYNKNEQ